MHAGFGIGEVLEGLAQSLPEGLRQRFNANGIRAGRDVTDLPPAHRDTSMMFQSFALFPHRTVGHLWSSTGHPLRLS